MTINGSVNTLIISGIKDSLLRDRFPIREAPYLRSKLPADEIIIAIRIVERGGMLF